MIQKTKPRRLKMIGRIFLQSIFYLGSIVLMVYIGYSKNRDKNWPFIKEIQDNQEKHRIESSALNSDSTKFTGRFPEYSVKSGN